MCPQKMGSHTLQNATALLSVNMFLCKHMKPTYQYTGLLYSHYVLQEFARSAMIFFRTCSRTQRFAVHSALSDPFSSQLRVFSLSQYLTRTPNKPGLCSNPSPYIQYFDTVKTALALVSVQQNCVLDLYKK